MWAKWRLCLLPTLTLCLISLSDPKLRPPEVISMPDTVLVRKVTFCELIGCFKVSLVVDYSQTLCVCVCLPYVGVRSWQDGCCYGWLDWQTFLTAMTVSSFKHFSLPRLPPPPPPLFPHFTAHTAPKPQVVTFCGLYFAISVCLVPFGLYTSLALKVFLLLKSGQN